MSADEKNQDAEQEVTHVEELPLEGGSKLVDQDEAADGAETVLPDGEHQPVKTEGFAHQLALSEHMNDPAFQSPTESHDEAADQDDQNDRLLPGTKAFHEAQQKNALTAQDIGKDVAARQLPDKEDLHAQRVRGLVLYRELVAKMSPEDQKKHYELFGSHETTDTSDVSAQTSEGEDEEAQHAGERRRWEALDMRKHALATAVQMAGQKPHMLEAHVVEAARSFLAFLQEKDDAPADEGRANG